MHRGSWLPVASLPLAVLAVAIAALATHSRFIVKKPNRTVLSGNTFEDTRDKTGNRFTYSVITDEVTGVQLGLYEALQRPGVPGALPGKSGSPPPHLHKTQTECFTLREGLLGLSINGTESIIEAGSAAAGKPVCIGPGVVHYYWNARNDTALRIDVTLQPPGNSIDFFRTLIGFGKDQGGLGNAGLPQGLTTFVAGDVQLTDFSPTAWWVIEHVLVPYFFVPVLGIEAMPSEYCSY